MLRKATLTTSLISCSLASEAPKCRKIDLERKKAIIDQQFEAQFGAGFSFVQTCKTSCRKERSVSVATGSSPFSDSKAVDFVGFNITPWIGEEIELEDDALRDQVDVRQWFANQRAKIPSISEQVTKLASNEDGAIVYLEIGYNERTPEGARENCHAEEIFRYVNYRIKTLVPDMTVVKVTAPKQLMREVESGFLQPSYEIDEIDEGKDIRDAYPKITHLKDSLDNEIFAFIRRVLTFELTGDCMYEPAMGPALDKYLKSLKNQKTEYSEAGNPAMPSPGCL